MEFLKIVAFSIVAAMMYGIVHDQITARICIEYFTVFHPPVFSTQSPTLLGIGWGIIATWWVGAFLGVLLGTSARAGSRRLLRASDLIRPISVLLAIMAICAIVAGLSGFTLARSGRLAAPQDVSIMLPRARYARFMADWWAHMASYASGFLGGLTLCAWVVWRRIRSSSSPNAAESLPIQF